MWSITRGSGTASMNAGEDVAVVLWGGEDRLVEENSRARAARSTSTAFARGTTQTLTKKGVSVA